MEQIVALLQDTGIWVLTSFVIFCYFAFKKGRGAVMAKIDGRIEDIRLEIESAASLRVEAQEILAQYERKQRDADRESKAIIAHAQEHVAAIQAQAETDLTEMIARREQQLADRLRRMEETAMAEIRAYATELALKATAEIIAEKLDEKSNARLVDESIKTIAGQLN